MKQKTVFDKSGGQMRIEGFVVKIMFNKALFKILLLDTCINQSFCFVNRITTKYIIHYHY